MTADEYRAEIKSLGLTPVRRAYEGSTVHQDRDGEFWTVPDPEPLTEEKRAAALQALKFTMDVD